MKFKNKISLCILVAEFYGHQNRTYYVKTCLSPDGRYIASGSSDELAYIWHTSKPGAPVVQLSGHTEEVTCIAWCTIGETKVLKMLCFFSLYFFIYNINVFKNYVCIDSHMF